jgi:hypothetical protein
MVLAAGLTPAAAHADSGWTTPGRVLDLTVEAPARFELRLEVESNPSRCRETQHFYRGTLDAASSRMFDLLLAAYRDGRAVRVYVTGVCDINGFAEISQVGTAP